MTTPLEQTGKARAEHVEKMFSKIAPKYDLMNKIMTGGQDAYWRREVIRRAKLDAGDSLLDLGAGTGDLAREGLKQNPAIRALAGDFTLNMMRAGRRDSDKLDWSATDALNLPFGDEVFDAIKPRKNILTPLINIHLHTIIPLIGGLLTGERDAYTYLPESTQQFLRAEELAVHIAAVGFENINFEIKMFGTVAIHWGVKNV